MDAKTLKTAVRARYAGAVTHNQGCCGPTRDSPASCCGTGPEASLRVGYDPADLEAVPAGANLGLGCGNPVALAALKPGETVLDLGSGAGFDAFLAARGVGPTGRVIGVDMTPEMIARATNLAGDQGYEQVEFRLGDIEALPVADASVDVILSNCVVNLTPDKARAFREAFRVLKPGGRLQISDLVLARPLPPALLEDLDAYAACVSGAMLKEGYLAVIRAAGFDSVKVAREARYGLAELSPELLAAARARYPELSPAELAELADSVLSVQVEATKAGAPCCAPSCCGG